MLGFSGKQGEGSRKDEEPFFFGTILADNLMNIGLGDAVQSQCLTWKPPFKVQYHRFNTHGGR